AEIRYHLEREIERNVAKGMPEDEARWAARRAFGNATATREAARAAWRWQCLDEVTQDVRFALRTLGRSRTFTAVAVLSLGVGIGASATVFSVLDAWFLRRLPVPEPTRLFYLRESVPPSRTLDDFPYEAFTRRRVARAPDVLTRTLTLNGTTYNVVGVTPRGFTGDWIGRPADIWFPVMMQSQVMIEEPGLITHRNASWLRIFARLEPGVSVERAEAVAQIAQQRTWRDWSGPNLSVADSLEIAGRRLRLQPAQRGYSPQREGSARQVSILAMVIGLLLLVTC